MGVEVRPFGVRCNIGCQYCYQNPERDAGNEASAYSLDRIREAVEAEGKDFILFGGEPLLMPEEDLEELWAWGLERFGKNGIQTNGTLINDRHVELFREYKVTVGISLDGPDELNDVRWAGSLAKTRELTRRSQLAIERLCAEGMAPSLIVTLHRNNAGGEQLPRLLEWVRSLVRLGVWSIRLHLLEIDEERVREKYALSSEENLAAMLAFLELETELREEGEKVEFDVFRDLRKLLLGRDRSSTCVWAACDPYTTRAVRGVEGHGQRSNCGRTNKDGIDFVKSDLEGFERYLALYHTPHEHGGCRGCRFFLMCKGQCPGTSLDGDWRNRTEHCETWIGLLSRLESDLQAEGHTPISVAPQRESLEQGFLAAWTAGRTTSMAELLEPSDASG